MAEGSTLANFTSLLAALSYLAGALLLWRAAEDRHGMAALAAGYVGGCLHAMGLLLVLLQQQGLSSSFYDAISLTAVIVVFTTLLSQRNQPTRLVLLPLYIVAGICVLLSTYLGQHHNIEAPSRGMLVHIISSITAYALLCASALYAWLLLATDSRLRKHEQLWAIALPPLQQTERTLFHTLRAGWLVLTVGIVSGLLSVESLFAQQLAHKTAFTLLSWLLFSILLAGHTLWGWRGRKAALWTIGGFAALVLAYLGSKFVLDVLLNKL